MRIVTDSGVDLPEGPQQADALGLTVVPLVVTLEDNSYREGVDIGPDEFYRLLEVSDQLPVTSQPSVGDFASVYRRLAAEDPDILSIHMSSGLSGTLNSARAAAKLVPEANITHVDTKTLSAASGWQVEVAAKALQAGWPLNEILDAVQQVSDASNCAYTLKDLKYLIHGGRISHMKGLIASVLRIKPLIGVEKVGGTYEQLGQARSFARAVRGLAEHIGRMHPFGSALRVQVLHSNNPEGADLLHDEVDARFDCSWMPVGHLSLVLGAHTGPTMIGVAYAPISALPKLP